MLKISNRHTPERYELTKEIYYPKYQKDMLHH